MKEPVRHERSMMNSTDETVIIVDDDPSVRKSLIRLLRSTGIRAEAYASAREFLARLPLDGKSCAILDMTLPDTTGLELWDQMAAQGFLIPTIFLTGGGDSVLRAERNWEENVVDFLTKPVDSTVLLNAVRLALSRPAPKDGQQ